MANEDMSGLSLGELKELAKKVFEQIVVAERQEVERAAEQIEAIARSLNITAKELIERSGLLGNKAKPGPKPSGKLSPIYRDKKDELNTWTGRGSQPKWVKEHVGGGGTLDELKIAA